MTRFSILDLAPIQEGGNAAQSFRQSLELAQQAEGWGYQRFWLAEHHGMPGIASAATAVLIAHIAGGTRTMRIGAGGIMLPNHSPLVIAEQFGTLESLFPGRIDLGLGRAPGSDQRTARALRRSLQSDADAFPEDVAELLDYFSDEPSAPVRAVPGTGLHVPVWILGSSLYGAQLAAMMGLPYAFASHFAPQQLMEAVTLYRNLFRPSAYLQKPYVMAGFNVFAADTDEQAHWLASSAQQAFLNLRSGRPAKIPPPVAGFLQQVSEAERYLLQQILACSAIGDAATVKAQILQFVQQTGVDELMIASNIFDHQARLHSYEIVSQLFLSPTV